MAEYPAIDLVLLRWEVGAVQPIEPVVQAGYAPLRPRRQALYHPYGLPPRQPRRPRLHQRFPAWVAPQAFTLVVRIIREAVVR